MRKNLSEGKLRLFISKYILFHKSENFSLKIRQQKSQTNIIMQLSTGFVNTRHIPHTYSYLAKNLPSVLNTECFNENKFSFKKEVRDTELGHLFEHILLDIICALKVEQGYDDAVYNGVTNWNWKKDPYGMFRISIDTGYDEEPLFHMAIKRTIEVFEELLTVKALGVTRSFHISKISEQNL